MQSEVIPEGIRKEIPVRILEGIAEKVSEVNLVNNLCKLFTESLEKFLKHRVEEFFKKALEDICYARIVLRAPVHLSD